MKRLLPLLTLTSLLLAACGSTPTFDLEPTAQAAATATLATQPTKTPTLTPTAVPTLTKPAIPTKTPEPTDTPTLILSTSTSTPTQPPKPTGTPGPCYGATSSGARQRFTFEKIVPCLTTPHLISQFMRNNLRFMYDESGRNYFQNARETFVRGGGDCEDSAMFAFEVLSQNGWSFMGNGWQDSGNWVGGFNVQWVETDSRGGHAVCLYKPSGQPLYYIDNDIHQLGIVRGPFANVAEVVVDISKRSQGEWRWYEFFDLNWNFGYGKVNRT
jgi:hypothetical protein